MISKTTMFSFIKKFKTTSEPIFIGGDGRSGTTLLSVILDSHSDLAVGPELHFGGPANLGPYIKKCLSLLIANDVRAYGAGLKQHPEYKLGVQFAKRCHRFGINFNELSVLIDESMRETGSELEDFSDRCVLIEKIGAHRIRVTGKKHWGIKIMRDIRRIDRYQRTWPGARFIHIIRDGRDVAASQLIEHGTWGYADIENAARGWKVLIQDVRRHGPSSNALEVRYEDLVMDSQRVIQNIATFLNCVFDDKMLSHHEMDHTLFENPYNHASIQQVVRPINSTSIGRFRNELSKDQQDVFWRIAGEELTALGYLR